MIRADAERLAAERNRARAAGDDQHWLAREHPAGSGEWQPVRVRLAGFAPANPLKATVEAKPRPQTPDDPRTGVFRDVPPYGAA